MNLHFVGSFLYFLESLTQSRSSLSKTLPISFSMASRSRVESASELLSPVVDDDDPILIVGHFMSVKIQINDWIFYPL